MDLNKQTFKTTLADRTLTVEVSRLAGQANGSALVKYGDTVVLSTAVMSDTDKPGDFFPLMVAYEERFYAAGKILGSRFIRREGRPSDESILSGRLIDRTIRPLFNSRLRRDVQVINTIFAIDDDNDPDFVALLASSIALAISDIPWGGPVAGVSTALLGKDLIVNPTLSSLKDTSPKFEAFYAGVKDKLNMIEVSANEAEESDIVASMKSALKAISHLIDFQNEIISAVGKKKAEVTLPAATKNLESSINQFLSDKLDSAIFTEDKTEHHTNLNNLKSALLEHISSREEFQEELGLVEPEFERLIDEAVHRAVLEDSRRVDGRALDEIRPLYSEVGIFARTHGTGLFVRGDTQALATVTLAPPGQEKLIETMEATTKKRFFLHYNFPPYSVGETGPMRGPGRREIGHGALAEKALRPLIPSTADFPYTIRIVSEILSSNGSSSMATVCAGSLALMDAGVPIKKPVAGIAMGIMTGQDSYKILTDIQGPEDHYGDMDFKVAGTRDGVTAIQMDVKIDGVTPDILAEGLTQAKKARLEILNQIESTIATPRKELSPFAPAISVIKINPDKIGELIGPGGKIINGIIDRTGATIDIDDDGTVFVSALSPASLEAALSEVKNITRELNVGDIVEGTVVRLMEFGAIVDLGGGKDGMIHVSELKDGFVKNVEDVIKVGDFVRAKVIKTDNGKIGLSIKQLGKK